MANDKLDKFKVTIVTYVTMVVLTFSNILYTTFAQQETEHKFCDIVNQVVEAYKASPGPTSELGVQLRDSYYKLQRDLDC